MGLKDELKAHVSKTHKDAWNKRKGQKVPETDDLGLGNDAVLIEGTVLYADLAESTKMVKGYKNWFAAEIYKNYLYCAAKVIRSTGGSITAYDGDRIMAVFIGSNKNTAAASAGLKINYAVEKILRPAIKTQYPKTPFILKQKVGIDTSQLFVARTGIRGSNDLVWVGNAANNAAKLSDLDKGYATYVSASSYSMLHEDTKYGGDPRRHMWTDLGSNDLGYKVYGSTWWRSF